MTRYMAQNLTSNQKHGNLNEKNIELESNTLMEGKWEVKLSIVSHQ